MVGLHLPSLREDLAGFRGSGEPNSRLPPGVPAPPVWWRRWWHHAGPDRVQRRPWLQRPPRGGSWAPHLLAPGPDSAAITRTLPSRPPAHLPPEGPLAGSPVPHQPLWPGHQVPLSDVLLALAASTPLPTFCSHTPGQASPQARTQQLSRQSPGPGGLRFEWEEQ